MNTEELKKRTKQFGLRCIKMVEALPNTRTLEMIIEAGSMSQKKLAALMKESDEMVAILTASSKTAKANLRKPISNQKSTINNKS